MLRLALGGNPITVIDDDDEDWQRQNRPIRPDQARVEISLGSSRVSAVDDRDRIGFRTRLSDTRADGRGILGFNRRRHRDNVIFRNSVVIDEISTLGIGVARHRPHLSNGINGFGTQGQRDGRRTIMQMQKIKINATTLLGLKPKGHVKRLFARTPDPKKSIATFAHLNESFFQQASANHELVDL
jgi:hypothetical protein